MNITGRQADSVKRFAPQDVLYFAHKYAEAVSLTPLL
jgi:hypothetical protein